MAEPQKRFWRKCWDKLFATSAALGTSLSNSLGIYGFGMSLAFGQPASIILAAILGLGTWGANQSVNDVAFDDFHRYKKEPHLPEAKFTKANLKNPKFWLFFLGLLAFIITAIMYGATAFVFGQWVLAVEIVSGILGAVAAIVTTIPEAENWVDPYYHEEDSKSIFKYIRCKKENLWALLLTFCNILALSTLFAIGLASFFQAYTPWGMASIIIASIVVGFSIGGFTEFYFYFKALCDFFCQLPVYWAALKRESIGFQIYTFAKVIANALGNGIATFAGIYWVIPLLCMGTSFAALAGPGLIFVAAFLGLAAAVTSLFICARFCGRQLVTAAAVASEGQDNEGGLPPREGSQLENYAAIRARSTTPGARPPSSRAGVSAHSSLLGNSARSDYGTGGEDTVLSQGLVPTAGPDGAAGRTLQASQCVPSLTEPRALASGCDARQSAQSLVQRVETDGAAGRTLQAAQSVPLLSEPRALASGCDAKQSAQCLVQRVETDGAAGRTLQRAGMFGKPTEKQPSETRRTQRVHLQSITHGQATAYEAVRTKASEKYDALRAQMQTRAQEHLAGYTAGRAPISAIDIGAAAAA